MPQNKLTWKALKAENDENKKISGRICGRRCRAIPQWIFILSVDIGDIQCHVAKCRRGLLPLHQNSSQRTLHVWALSIVDAWLSSLCRVWSLIAWICIANFACEVSKFSNSSSSLRLNLPAVNQFSTSHRSCKQTKSWKMTYQIACKPVSYELKLFIYKLSKRRLYQTQPLVRRFKQNRWTSLHSHHSPSSTLPFLLYPTRLSSSHPNLHSQSLLISPFTVFAASER